MKKTLNLANEVAGKAVKAVVDAKKAQFNINEYVRVKLTASGKLIYREYFDSLGLQSKEAEAQIAKAIKGDWLQEQLWVVMRIFGEHMVMGMPMPFEANIEFVVPL